MKPAFIAAILGAALCGGALHGAEPPVGLLNSREHRLMSKAVGCEYVIQVRLPDSYDKGDARYPVVYVLDGDIVFGLASDVATQLPRRKDGPEVIVVGVAYGGTVDTWWNTRARDLTPACRNAPAPKEFPNGGGARNFQDFLATELMPYVDSRYRTQPGDRTLVGYSFSGTFAMHILFTQPELFQRYVIISPGLGWDKDQLFETEAEYHARSSRLPAVVYLAYGDQEGRSALARFRRLVQLLDSRHYEGLRWMSQVFPDETHMSIYPVAFTHGLKSVHSPAGASFAADLAEKEQAAIRQDVSAAVQGMFAAEGRLDAEAAWAYHADVPGYRWADIDGQFYDYAGARKVWADYIANCTKLTSTTAHEEVMVLGPNLAFYLWQGTVEATQKDGSVSRNEVWTARYLCQRINGAWKIVGGQESALPPQLAPPKP